MATREENLKKINTELEKMSDEQLEKVAGGGIYMFDPKKPDTDNICKVANTNPAENQLGARLW